MHLTILFFLFSIADRLRDALGEVGFQLNSAILSVLMMRYIRKDGTLRFGDFVAIILNLSIAFGKFFRAKRNFHHTDTQIKIRTNRVLCTKIRFFPSAGSLYKDCHPLMKSFMQYLI